MAEIRVWRFGLMRLGYSLLVEASEHPNEWITYQLKDSPVLVACRWKADRYTMRIGKPDKDHKDRWQQELAAMETFLGLVGWTKQEDRKAKGYAMMYTGEAAPLPTPQDLSTNPTVQFNPPSTEELMALKATWRGPG